LMNMHSVGSFAVATKALGEDGVAHHYLPNEELFAKGSQCMLGSWNEFIIEKEEEIFEQTVAWSYSAIFKESPLDISRVTKLGCGIVEMEAATLFAIGEEKEVETLALFVISDEINLTTWKPMIKESVVRDHLHKMALLAFEYVLDQEKK
ncbi:MAG: hypothetical protein KAR79_02240, partial [Simkaniaceae bacterium]|nr:hypothetical protein [Simkaniaceae bacterium]